MSSDLILGVDGGGSHTRAVLANAHGEIIGRGEAGAGNPHANGLEAAHREILAAVARAFADARIEGQRVAAAAVGAGGVDRRDERRAWMEWVREHLAERVVISNDGELVVAAGTPDNWGIGVIAGTGSMAWGKSPAGEIKRAGGWGFLIGDEGSAFALARDALRAATYAADGRGQFTELLPAILEHWHLAEPQDLIPKLYRSGLRHTDIARLAPLVTRTAEQGDELARRIVFEAGRGLAIATVAVARGLQLEHVTIPLTLTGGLLLGASGVRHVFLNELVNRAEVVELELKFRPVELVHEPVLGAVRIARELLNS